MVSRQVPSLTLVCWVPSVLQKHFEKHLKEHKPAPRNNTGTTMLLSVTLEAAILATFGLIWTSASPLPQSSVHVKFLSPTQNYAHGVEIISPDAAGTYSHDGSHQVGSHVSHVAPITRRRLSAIPRSRPNYIIQHPGPAQIKDSRTYVYPSERRLISTSNLQHATQYLTPSQRNNPEAMYPTGVFLPPSNDLSSLIALESISHHQQYAPSQHLDVEPEVDDPLLLTGEDAIATVKYLFGRGELYWDAIPHVRALERNQEERRFNGLEVNRLSSNRPESPYYRGGLPYGVKNRRRSYYAF